jgi:hypothetical protein
MRPAPDSESSGTVRFGFRRKAAPLAVGGAEVRLHALTSLIAQAQQLLPDAVHDAHDQELTWTQIGELLNTTAATAARRYRTSHDQLDKDHRHNADERALRTRTCADRHVIHVESVWLSYTGITEYHVGP